MPKTNSKEEAKMDAKETLKARKQKVNEAELEAREANEEALREERIEEGMAEIAEAENLAELKPSRAERAAAKAQKAENAEIVAETKPFVLEPRETEKTYNEQTKRVYVFLVERRMSKQLIAKLVEKQYGVTVEEVKTLIRKGKKTRYSRGKRAYPGTTYRQDKKFAYVKLAEGDSIQVFEEDNTSAKEADKADKNAGKESK